MSPSPLGGLWLPLITPFLDGALDEASLRRLIRHYAKQRLDGLVLAGTTGEAATLTPTETHALIEIARDEMETIGCALPVFLGLSGSGSAEVVHKIEATARWPIDGLLLSSPHYIRPPQDGMVEHFLTAAQATDRPILIYNIPYRTGINMSNETLLELATLPNIVGLKDCCNDPAQSFALFKEQPADFAILTGEDLSAFVALCLGANGAILSVAHVQTAAFAEVIRLTLAGDMLAARDLWLPLHTLAVTLLSETSPAGVKHALWRQGLISSAEVRAPMQAASAALATRLDQVLA